MIEKAGGLWKLWSKYTQNRVLFIYYICIFIYKKDPIFDSILKIGKPISPKPATTSFFNNYTSKTVVLIITIKQF